MTFFRGPRFSTPTLQLIKHTCYCIRGCWSSLGAFSFILQMNHISSSLLSSHSFFSPPNYPPNHSFSVSIQKVSGLPRKSTKQGDQVEAGHQAPPWMKASFPRGDTFIPVQSWKMLEEKESSFSWGRNWRDFPERMDGSFFLALGEVLIYPKKVRHADLLWQLSRVFASPETIEIH